ncbi:MAG TPA: hypothetical protein VGU71_22305 [Candidatus Dormibacteraeota bacterium]|nr:hypothetical protein [Candidatus Dormibacteraeota bacterium]
MRQAIVQRDDVLGDPSIPRNHQLFKGAYVDGGPAISASELAARMAELENTITVGRKAASLDAVSKSSDGAILQKWADMGIPVMRMMERASGFTESQQRYQDALSKMGLSPDVAKEITLAGIGNWTLTDGPWLYDLEAPALRTFPVLTPIINKMPRDKGTGTSARFRRIDSITNSQTGTARLRASFGESVSTTFRGLALNRPQRVAYGTSIVNLPYALWGYSDDLTWTAQFAGREFEDLRALITRNLIYVHKMGEEDLVLGGRITALATPAAPTLTQRLPNASAGEVASTSLGNCYVKTTALGHYGESIPSAATTIAFTAGNVIDVTVANAFSAGAHGFRAYASTAAGADPGDGSRFRVVWNAGPAQGLDYSGGNVMTISGTFPTLLAVVASDTSGNSTDCDGMMTLTAANGGVSTRLNGNLTLDAINKQLFYPLFQNFGGDPDEVFVNALESVRITDLVLGAAGTPFRVVVNADSPGDVIGGYRVSRLMNKVTGKLVDVTVHRYLEQGNLLAVAWSVPFPAEGITVPWKLRMVQDLLEVDWPVIQMSYDVSTYAFGVLVPHAPVFNGVLQGIQPA